MSARAAPGYRFGMVIDVLGLPGDATAALASALDEAIAELGLGDVVAVRRIGDPGLMIARGVRKPPALIIDGTVVCRGRAPSAAEIRDYLRAAEAQPRPSPSGDQPPKMCG